MAFLASAVEEGPLELDLPRDVDPGVGIYERHALAICERRDRQLWIGSLDVDEAAVWRRLIEILKMDAYGETAPARRELWRPALRDFAALEEVARGLAIESRVHGSSRLFDLQAQRVFVDPHYLKTYWRLLDKHDWIQTEPYDGRRTLLEVAQQSVKRDLREQLKRGRKLRSELAERGATDAAIPRSSA